MENKKDIRLRYEKRMLDASKQLKSAANKKIKKHKYKAYLDVAYQLDITPETVKNYVHRDKVSGNGFMIEALTEAFEKLK